MTRWLRGLLSAITFREKLGSKMLLIFSKSLMVLDFCAIVEPLAPKCSAISEGDMFKGESLLKTKLMLQIVYTAAAAHISSRPDCKGQERLRPSFCISFVHNSAHSSSKCSLQNVTASDMMLASLSLSCCLSIELWRIWGKGICSFLSSWGHATAIHRRLLTILRWCRAVAFLSFCLLLLFGNLSLFFYCLFFCRSDR